MRCNALVGKMKALAVKIINKTHTQKKISSLTVLFFFFEAVSPLVSQKAKQNEKEM